MSPAPGAARPAAGPPRTERPVTLGLSHAAVTVRKRCRQQLHAKSDPRARRTLNYRAPRAATRLEMPAGSERARRRCPPALGTVSARSIQGRYFPVSVKAHVSSLLSTEFLKERDARLIKSHRGHRLLFPRIIVLTPFSSWLRWALSRPTRPLRPGERQHLELGEQSQ